MRYNLPYVVVEVTDRRKQLAMLWGCMVGFFKKLPVIVYEDEATIDDPTGYIQEQVDEARELAQVEAHQEESRPTA